MAKSIGLEATMVALQLGAAVGQLVIEAIANDDVETLKKVNELFPRGHDLRAMVALAAADERARQQLANL